MTNQQIAQLLRQLAAAFQVRKAEPFRQVAYQKAADNIQHYPKQLKTLWQQDKLQTVPGVGRHLNNHLKELFSTGKVSHFNSITQKLPQGMFVLLDIPGIGAKNAYKLAKHLGLTRAHSAVSKLKKAALQGEIKVIEGFGLESQQAILDGISRYRKLKATGDRVLLSAASLEAEKLINYMQKVSQLEQIYPLGSLRRRAATVGDIDLAVASPDPKTVINRFISYPDRKKILAQGKNTARIILKNSIQVDLKVQTSGRFGALLQHFTGSKAHNVRLRELALKKHLSLSEYGIKVKGKVKNFAAEKPFYNFLGLDYIPPELREDRGEIEAAATGNLPKLITQSDIKGDLHSHTSYNWASSHDYGSDSIDVMAEKAIRLGYQYLGLSDHNPSLTAYNNSSKKIEEAIKARREAIEHSKYSKKIKLLNSMEIDIRANGNLAVSDQALKLLDYAVVSVHSNLTQNSQDMTKRIIAGLSHPKVKILGHPGGRLINRRQPIQADWEQIFAFVAKNQQYLEINSQPSRLDLPANLVKDALKHKLDFVINTDAHAAAQLELIRYGVDTARRGWLSSDRVVNTLPYLKLRAKLNL